MSQIAEERLSPKVAVEKAFEHFKLLFSGQGVRHLLLEGIRFDEGRECWEVTVGFDIGRERKVGGQLAFLNEEREPIREFRVIRINAVDGSFIELDHE